MAKNCSNCGNRKGDGYFTGGTCLVSGNCCSTERMFRDVCDINFSKWVPRPSLWTTVKGWFS